MTHGRFFRDNDDMSISHSRSRAMELKRFEAFFDVIRIFSSVEPKIECNLFEMPTFKSRSSTPGEYVLYVLADFFE